MKAAPAAAVARTATHLVCRASALGEFLVDRAVERDESRRRQLTGMGRRLRTQALKGRSPISKYPILLATVAECYVEVLDEIVGMFDQALSGIESRAKNKVQEKLAQRGKENVDKLDLLGEMLVIASDLAIPAAEVGPLLRERVGLERMRAARRDPQDRPQRDHGHLDTVEDSFTYLRQFAPTVIKAIGFAGSSDTEPLLKAVDILRTLYSTGARTVPAGAPTSFVPTRWQGYLARTAEEGNTVHYRHYGQLVIMSLIGSMLGPVAPGA